MSSNVNSLSPIVNDFDENSKYNKVRICYSSKILAVTYKREEILMTVLEKSKLFSSPKLDSRIKSANVQKSERWLGFFAQAPQSSTLRIM